MDRHAIKLQIRPLKAGEAGNAFRTLNEEWIERHFTLEDKDRETLGDPDTHILAKGGYIFLAFGKQQGLPAIGCVALIPMGGGVYELAKMAVAPGFRRQGIGRALLEHAIERAREIGAHSLFLGSSTKLPAALRLYESAGFEHVPPGEVPPSPYVRANVFMRLPLGEPV